VDTDTDTDTRHGGATRTSDSTVRDDGDLVPDVGQQAGGADACDAGVIHCWSGRGRSAVGEAAASGMVSVHHTAA